MCQWPEMTVPIVTVVCCTHFRDLRASIILHYINICIRHHVVDDSTLVTVSSYCCSLREILFLFPLIFFLVYILLQIIRIY